MSVPEDLKRFFDDNPGLYSGASPDDIEQLCRICKFYPDSVRLLKDRDAVKVPGFGCKMCGTCCSKVKYVPVCNADIKRWVQEKRFDILAAIKIDRRKTPLLAACGAEAIENAKRDAGHYITSCGGVYDVPYNHVHELLYLTDLLETVAYAGRKNGSCEFLIENPDGHTACSIHSTKPKVCSKFPYYLNGYTDARLINKESFCPALKELYERLCIQS